MRRFTIPAGSTSGEKERGNWIKLTDEELERIEVWYNRSLDREPHDLDKKLRQKIHDARRFGA